MDDSTTPDLLKVLKTLADASRLKILGLLSQRELNVGAIAQELALTEPTISHHLGRLVAVDFVKVRKAGTQRIYSLDVDHVAAFQRALGAQTTPLPDAHRGADDEAKKVLKAFIKDGKLVKIPETLRKRRVILEWLVSQLEFRRKYPERDINAFLKRFHEDFATLRRELVDRQLMARENAVYWRI
jgi:hypothetical protein